MLVDLSKYNKIILGLSGGLDSKVLLHQLAHSEFRSKLLAVHINHGLSPNANAWQQHCAASCASWNVDFTTEKLQLPNIKGASIEAQARELRYQALQKHLINNSVLLTAHHQDDQAETILLQLFRGAGPRGLAAMGHRQQIAAIDFIRPLLTYSKQQLLQYAQQHNLTWVEDESNQDLRFDRNYLRKQIIPKLQQRWPQVSKCLQRSAELAAESSLLLDELAMIDFKSCALTDASLSCSELAMLSTARQRNVIRYWLRRTGFKLPDQKHLLRVVNEVIPARIDAQAQVQWQDVVVTRFKNKLYAYQELLKIDLQQEYSWDISKTLDIPNIGSLSAQVGRGVKLANDAVLTVKFRNGGERFNPVGFDGSKSLKKLLQDWQVPPWLRDRLPLIYLKNELIAVADIAIARDYQCTDDESGFIIKLIS